MNTQLLRLQWNALRAWLDDADVLDHADEPSGLDGWTIGELVAHTGRGFTALSALRPAPDAQPLTLQAYVAAYAPAAEEIAEGTRELAASIEDDMLVGIDRCAREGFDALGTLAGPVVLGARGPIKLDDFVMTRIIELVVHGDDLGRALPKLTPPPLLDEAVAGVSAALADAYTDATGLVRHVSDPIDWIRRSTGRIPTVDPALPLI